MSSVEEILPVEGHQALLVGRVWDTETGGPRPVLVREDEVYDLLAIAPTVSALLELDDLAVRLGEVDGPPSWRLDDLIEASLRPELGHPKLLAPVDLEVVKACGVTFADSMVERVIEERCAGDASRADQVREIVFSALGDSVGSVIPGSPEAAALKEVLLGQDLWSQYLEVGLGPHPEVFTKAPVLSSVGFGAKVGIPEFSSWNNPEPELVLVVDSAGGVRGATLGNDVNLRDVEGRSALLLGMAKDNNASSALGPFVRIFSGDFTLDTLRDECISLTVTGAEDGYMLTGENRVGRLSRSFERLIEAAYGPHHQYPDGFVLYTGTLFAPTQDRGSSGLGFTHKIGDEVVIRSPHLGTAEPGGKTESLPEWDFGIGALLTYIRAHAGTAPEAGRGETSRGPS